ASPPAEWCTFQFLKLVHFSVPVDTLQLLGHPPPPSPEVPKWSHALSSKARAERSPASIPFLHTSLSPLHRARGRSGPLSEAFLWSGRSGRSAERLARPGTCVLRSLRSLRYSA